MKKFWHLTIIFVKHKILQGDNEDKEFREHIFRTE